MYFEKSQLNLIKFLKVFGFHPYALVGDKMSDCELIYNFVIKNLILFANVFNLKLAMGIISEDVNNITMKVFLINDVIEIWFNQFAIFSLYFLNILFKDSQIKFHTLMKGLESQLARLNEETKSVVNMKCIIFKEIRNSRINSNTIFILQGLLFLYIIFQTETFFINFVATCWYLRIFVSSYCVNIVMIYLINIIKIVKCYLDILYEIVAHSEKSKENLCKILQIVVHLKHVVEEFSETYGIIVLSAYLMSFGSITAEIFNWLKYVQQQHEVQHIASIVTLLCYLIWYSILLFLVSLIGKTCSEVEEIYAKNMELLNSSNVTVPIINIIIMEGLEELKFNSCGFDSIDESILFKVNYFIYLCVLIYLSI